MRKWLNIELDKPIAIVDMSTANDEVQKDLKSRIIDAYKAAKKPIITSESLSQRKKREEDIKKTKDAEAEKEKKKSLRDKIKASYIKEKLRSSKAKHMKFE